MHAQAAATPPAPRRRPLGIAAVLLLLAAGGGALYAAMPRGQADTAALDPAWCAPSPPQARADPAGAADRELDVQVPVANRAFGEAADGGLQLTQGQVVKVRVHTPRPGGVAVHGLMETAPLAVGSETTVAFRAIYSGRFPLHFHGADGSHFEIAVFQVLPPAGG